MTYKDVVSRVVNSTRQYTKDEHISRRWVLSILKSKCRNLTARYEDSEKFEDIEYKKIGCYELVKDNIVDCPVVQFKKCGKLMKGKHKLPQGIKSSYRKSILYATTLDGGKIFWNKNLTDFNNIKSSARKRFSSLFNEQGSFYIVDGVPYFPDTELEAVHIYMATFEDDIAESNCSECDDDEGECVDIWEKDFNCASRFEDAVVSSTLQEVYQSLGIPMDEMPNSDENEKTRVTN